MPQSLAKFESSISSSMSTAIDQIQRIQDQVHTLIERYRLAISELEEKSLQVENLSRELMLQKQKGSTMQSEIEQLRLLMAFNGTQAERQALKSQLNEWVREINKCLAQLNA